MVVNAILVVSVLLQLAAAALALRLIRITGRAMAWLLLSGAIVLMSLRRIITLSRVLAGHASITPDLAAETVALVISVLMLAGIAAIEPVFRSIRAAEAMARESEEQFRQIAENIKAVVRLTDWTSRTLLYVSPSYEAVFGRSIRSAYADRLSWKDLVHPDDRAQVDDVFSEARIEAGEQIDLTYRIVRDDGQVRWLHDRGFPVRGQGGGVDRIVGLAEDVTERIRVEQRNRLLADELDHRVKNNLAIVTALAGETSRSSSTIEEFREAFTGRILALGSTHAALAAARWEGVDLRTLLKTTLASSQHGGDQRVEIDGPNVVLSNKACGPLTLTVHELLTNSFRHGALSTQGRLRVAWSLVDGDLQLEWEESGGPPITGPVQEGTGTTLMRGLVEYELHGRLTFDYRREGLRCTIGIPLRMAVTAALNAPC